MEDVKCCICRADFSICWHKENGKYICNDCMHDLLKKED